MVTTKITITLVITNSSSSTSITSIPTSHRHIPRQPEVLPQPETNPIRLKIFKGPFRQWSGVGCFPSIWKCIELENYLSYLRFTQFWTKLKAASRICFWSLQGNKNTQLLFRKLLCAVWVVGKDCHVSKLYSNYRWLPTYTWITKHINQALCSLYFIVPKICFIKIEQHLQCMSKRSASLGYKKRSFKTWFEEFQKSFLLSGYYAAMLAIKKSHFNSVTRWLNIISTRYRIFAKVR